MKDKKKISIDINHPCGAFSYSVGWIYVTFKTDNTTITIHVSDVFNPVFELLFIFWGLMKGAIPQEIEVDEEGEIKIIRILPGHKDKVRFQIEDYDYGEPDDEDPEYPRMHIDIEVEKDFLIKEFFTNFISFLENDFKPERWRETNLRSYFLPQVKNAFLSYTNSST
jgi:hypothetical protein